MKKRNELDSIEDESYFLHTTTQLKYYANLMNLNYSDIPINSRFKRKLFIRIKKHIKNYKLTKKYLELETRWKII
jgi:hypothetical protein